MSRYYRRFVTEIERDDLIPPVPFDAPELAALEAERRRLANALRDAQRSGPTASVSEEGYRAARAQALREGRPLPPEPPAPAEVQAGIERRARAVAAAEAALVRLGDDLCATVANHPEWVGEAVAHVERAEAEAAEARRLAEDADRRARRAEVVVKWLRHVAEGELYVADFGDRPDVSEFVITDPDDPRVADLVRASREHGGI